MPLRIHDSFVQSGLSTAHIIVQTILAGKTLDPEQLCLLAALIPFCTSGLDSGKTPGKKHSFQAVLNGLADLE
jgi:hypothetical protein